jgi:formylglycine-generating enzyme required for sulfatase activity
MRPVLLSSLVSLALSGFALATADEPKPRAAGKQTIARKTANETPTPASPAELPTTLTNSIGMKLVLIPAGNFQMGSDRGFDDEVPVHRVTLTRPFYLGVTEVTQAQYEETMGDNPSQLVGRPDLPVDTVPWDKAVAFCEKLSEREGVKYRLPTEAEWEYACRAGGTGRFGLGEGGVEVTGENVEEYAWFRLNSAETQPVAQKKPNAWGLYDMHGNVFEWCQDNWLEYPNKPAVDPVALAPKGQKKGEWFVLRGGSWEWGLDNGTASARCRCKKALRSRTVGFRVARSVTGEGDE